MATFHRTRRAALPVASAAVLGLVAGCGNSGDGDAAPSSVPAPASVSVPPGTTASPTTPGADGTSRGPGPGVARTLPAPAGSAGGTSSTDDSARCHTSDLRASVGRNRPGAGQENFPVVFTNDSARTCTVRGYPGAAFLDASGRQLGPGPERAPGVTARTVTLSPGRSAWSGLSFSSPQVSGATARTPAVLLVTPPDERTPVRVTWQGGPVPVSGNASTVHLTVLAPGSGA